MLKLNIFILWKIIMRFHVDCRPQIRIVYFKSHCNRWNEALGSGSMGSWLSVLEFGNQSKLRANRRNTRRSLTLYVELVSSVAEDANKTRQVYLKFEVVGPACQNIAGNRSRKHLVET